MNAFPRLLREGDVPQMERDALRILGQIGLKCDHPRALADLAAEGATVDAGRVKLHADRVAEHWARTKARVRHDLAAALARPGDDAFRLGGQWNCLELCDPETNLPRPATTAEAAGMAKLAESLGSRGCPIPVAPSDVDPRVRTLASERIALQNTHGLGGWLTATDPVLVEAHIAMYQAAGRRYPLGLEGLISPLALNGRILEVYYAWCDDERLDIGIMGGIPVVGTTAPLSFPAALALALAEAIALDYVMTVLSRGRHSVFNLRLDAFDMRHSNLLFGSPEWCLMARAVREAHEGLFGAAGRGGCFRSNGKRVDAQTVLERTTSFYWQASLGARAFSSVGQTCLDEVYSPVLAVLDAELVRHGAQLDRGFPEATRDSADVLEVVREGLDDGYIATATTAERFRDFYDLDRLTTAEGLGAWRAAGMPSLESRARAEAERRVAEHDFALDAAAAREIDAVYRTACRQLGVEP